MKSAEVALRRIFAVSRDEAALISDVCLPRRDVVDTRSGVGVLWVLCALVVISLARARFRLDALVVVVAAGVLRAV